MLVSKLIPSNKQHQRKVIQPNVDSIFEKWKLKNDDDNKQKQRQQSLSTDNEHGVRKLTPRRKRRKTKKNKQNQLDLICFFNQESNH